MNYMTKGAALLSMGLVLAACSSNGSSLRFPGNIRPPPFRTADSHKSAGPLRRRR